MMKIQNVCDPAFRRYGRILTGLDVSGLLDAIFAAMRNDVVRIEKKKGFLMIPSLLEDNG